MLLKKTMAQIRSTEPLNDLASIFHLNVSPGSQTAHLVEWKVPEISPGDLGAQGPAQPGVAETAGRHQGKTLYPRRPRQLLALKRRYQQLSGMNMNGMNYKLN